MNGLVDYSSDEDEHVTKKVKSLPPLPDSFYQHYITSPRTSDDPSFHNGRSRTYEHMPGKWPSHVYLEWIPAQDEFRILSDVLNHIKGDISRPITSLLENNLHVKLPLHVSLSETLMLDTSEKDSFLKSITSYISEKSILKLSFQTSIKILYNKPRTRQFLTIPLKTDDNDVVQWIEKVNEICNSFGNPTIESDLPHISIGSIDNNPENDNDNDNDNYYDNDNNNHYDNHYDTNIALSTLEQISALTITFDEVKIRIGRDVHIVKLKNLHKAYSK